MALLAIRFLMIAALGALVALMLYAGEPTKLWWWLYAIPFGAWITGPVVAPYFLARQLKSRRWFVYVMLAFLSLSIAWAASVYYHAFFVSNSSTAALVIIFVPFYQWAALACVGLTSGGAMVLLNRREPRN